MRPRLQSALDLVLGRAPASGRVRRARQQASEDDGFTIVETLVTLLVVSVVVGLVLGFVTNLVQQSTNVRDTMAGVQQDQTAGEGLLQYLHSSIVVLPGSNATTLETSILAGVSSGGTPQTATFGAALTPPAGPKLDANFSTSLTPNGGTTRTLNDYDAVSSPTAFTYYYNNYSVTPVVLASTTTPTNAQLSEIVAVGVDVTFLAGPQVPTAGFQAVHPTTFQTTVYLQNAAGAPAPTTSTSVTPPSGTIAAGSPLTVTATVSPIPDGGTVTFTVTQGGVALSACTSPVDVSTSGSATCTFTPATSGTYVVTASFSGTDDFQPSTGTASITVPMSTSTTIAVSATKSRHSQDTLTVTATVSPSAATGTVEFTLQVCSTGRSGGCNNYSGQSSLSAGSATWSQASLQSGDTYTVSATYEGSSTYSGSTSATSSSPPNLP